MNGVFWAIFLISFQFDFLYLNYILPAIGVMALYLQLRKFSGLNRSFKKACRFSAALLFYEILSFAVSATPLSLDSAAVMVFSVVNTVLQVGIFLHLQSALAAEYEKAGIEAERNHWLIWLVVWKFGVYVILFMPQIALIVMALIALIVILIGLYLCLRDAGKTLFAEEEPSSQVSRWYRRPLVLCCAYGAAIFLAVIGGAYFGQISFQELEPLEKANYEGLVAKGMPLEIAQCLCEEDITKLEHAKEFKVLEPFEQFGQSDTEVTAVCGVTDYDRFVTVVWFSRDAKSQYSRDVITIDGDTEIPYDGQIIYTQADGKKVCREIDMYAMKTEEYGTMGDFFGYTGSGSYLEAPAVRSAKKISGYVCFDAGTYDEYDEEEDIPATLNGRMSVAWYGMSRLQFPYLQAPKAIEQQAFSKYVEYFYLFDESGADIESVQLD